MLKFSYCFKFRFLTRIILSVVQKIQKTVENFLNFDIIVVGKYLKNIKGVLLYALKK
ncbi:MAG: hypothetical protein RUMPE_00548 [Eubacteriales bacterium SKADARSKE-1]|nr:hypothetical protein [Eubacteriales bacterium SKADARSKE-1]